MAEIRYFDYVDVYEGEKIFQYMNQEMQIKFFFYFQLYAVLVVILSMRTAHCLISAST